MWLAVLRRTHGLTRRTRGRVAVREDENPITEDELEDVTKHFGGVGDNGNAETANCLLAVPLNFATTVPPLDPSAGDRFYGPPPPTIGNPHRRIAFCALGLDHRITVPFAGGGVQRQVEQQQQPFFKRRPPPAPSRRLVPSAAIHVSGRSGNEPGIGVDDDDEIDLEDMADDVENDADSHSRGPAGKNKDMPSLERAKDPGEINPDESEEEGASKDDNNAGGDSVCFSPPSNVARREETANGRCLISHAYADA